MKTSGRNAGNEIRPQGIGFIHKCVIVGGDGEGKASLYGGNSIELPTTDQCFYRATGIACDQLTLAEWQVIEEAGHKTLTHIVAGARVVARDTVAVLWPVGAEGISAHRRCGRLYIHHLRPRIGSKQSHILGTPL